MVKALPGFDDLVKGLVMKFFCLAAKTVNLILH